MNNDYSFRRRFYESASVGDDLLVSVADGGALQPAPRAPRPAPRAPMTVHLLSTFLCENNYLQSQNISNF